MFCLAMAERWCCFVVHLCVVLSVFAHGQCVPGQLAIKYEDGSIRCVDCELCPAGFGMNHNCHYGNVLKWPVTIKCIPCSKTNEFAKKSYDQCKKCRDCPLGEVEIKTCQPFHDRECGCPPGESRDHLGTCELIPTSSSTVVTTTVKVTSASILNGMTVTSTIESNTEIPDEPKWWLIPLIVGSIALPCCCLLLLSICLYRTGRCRKICIYWNTQNLCRNVSSNDGHPTSNQSFDTYEDTRDHDESLYARLDEGHVTSKIDVTSSTANGVSPASSSAADDPANVQEEDLDDLIEKIPHNMDVELEEVTQSTFDTMESCFNATPSPIAGDVRRIWEFLLRDPSNRKRYGDICQMRTFKDVFGNIKAQEPKFTLCRLLRLLKEIERGDVVKATCLKILSGR